MRMLSQAPHRIDRDTVAVVYRYETTGRVAEGRHHHPTLHQLSWSPAGVLSVEVGDIRWTVPPSLSIWIPAGHSHEIHRTSGRVECYDVKSYPPTTPIDWSKPNLITVTPLLRSLIVYLADPDLEDGARRRAEAVLFDQFHPAPVPGIEVPMPTDPRALGVARALLRNPADDRPLQGWARHARSSPRTLTRLFSAQTGMSFHNWRLQVRIDAALSHLAAGEAVTTVGRKVGYQNTSAFIEAFRRKMGSTPTAFCSQFFP